MARLGGAIPVSYTHLDVYKRQVTKFFIFLRKMRMRVEPCLMMEKIEWYQEVLKLDPDSKVFFPLAKLLRDSQQPDKAIEVLRAGLQHSSRCV